MGILLGVLSAASWGTSDFMGGLLTRRMSALRVLAWSQLAGAVLIVVIALLAHAPITLSIIGWGMFGGISGIIGLLALYRGLALGPMALVSPISACGAIVPLIAAAISGRLPPPVALVGIALAFGGIVLASLAGDTPSPQTKQPARLVTSGVGYAGIAALGIGFFFIALAHGAAGQPLATLWTVASARLTTIIVLFGALTVRRADLRVPRGNVAQLIGIGFFDTGANTLYAFATTFGNLGIVSVLGSLYPVMTVLLALGVLRERLALRQSFGVVLALAGVTLMALG